MQVRLLLTASVKLSSWFYLPFPSSGQGCAPSKARVEPWLMPAACCAGPPPPGYPGGGQDQKGVFSGARLGLHPPRLRRLSAGFATPFLCRRCSVLLCQGRRARGTTIRLAAWVLAPCAGCEAALLSRGIGADSD